MLVREARGEYVRWLLATRDLSPHTIRAYDCDIVSFERYVGRRARVEVIDQELLIRFFEEQKGAGLSATSIRRRASALRGFCRWLTSRRLLPSDPAAGTTFALGRSRKLPRVLSSYELRQLLLSLRESAGIEETPPLTAVCRRPHEATTLLAVALMVMTGVRVHEVAGIRCRDIDLPGRGFRLVGKGRRERQVFLTNDWIVELMHGYLAARAEFGIEHPHLLFNQRYEPLTPPAMRLRLLKAAQGAGLTARVTPHMLRHTAATQLIEAGVDIRYIQRLLGHASLSTTEIYTHVSDRTLKRIVSDADVLGGAMQLR